MILYCVALEEETEGYEGRNLDLLITGVGKLNAAMSLQLEILRRIGTELEIDRVINVGTCGAHKSVETGTIVTPTRFEDGSSSTLVFPDHYPPIGEHVMTDDFYDPKCVSYDEFKSVIGRYTIADMEAYALARICRTYDIDFECHKIVTDGGNLNDWRDNVWKLMPRLWDSFD